VCLKPSFSFSFRNSPPPTRNPSPRPFCHIVAILPRSGHLLWHTHRVLIIETKPATRPASATLVFSTLKVGLTEDMQCICSLSLLSGRCTLFQGVLCGSYSEMLSMHSRNLHIPPIAITRKNFCIKMIAFDVFLRFRVTMVP
jgi:hypothetical protein